MSRYIFQKIIKLFNDFQIVRLKLFWILILLSFNKKVKVIKIYYYQHLTFSFTVQNLSSMTEYITEYDTR